MENFEAELQRRVDEAVAANDLATLDGLLRTLYEKADEADRPLDAAIRGANFGPKLEAPEGSDEQTQLMAFLGRQV